MKKNLLLTIMCLLGFFGTLKAQDVVTIDGTVGEFASGTSVNVPIYNNYEYAVTQQYYTVDEIGKASGTIESIAFKTTDQGVYPFTRTIDVYMVNTSEYYFDPNVGNGKQMAQVSADDLVFSGSVEFTSDSWNTIALDTDFEYTGENLLICINDYSGTWASGDDKAVFSVFTSTYTVPFQGSTGLARRALYIKNSNSKYDPTASAISGTTTSQYVPFVQLTFASGTTEEFLEPAVPANFKAEAVSESKIQLTWDAAENAVAYNVYQGTERIAENITETSLAVKNLSLGEYCFTVEAVSGPYKATTEPECVTLVAKNVKSIQIGNAGGNESLAVPFANAFTDHYSWFETLYTAEEMGGACTIERLSFVSHVGGTYQTYAPEDIRIYLAETTKTDYADKTWTAEEDLTLVYSDSDIILGDQEWETFEFTAPFEYSGEKNLVVVVAKASDKNENQLFWYCLDSKENSSLLIANETDSSYAQYPSEQGNVNANRPVVRFAWESDEVVPTPTAPAAPVVTTEATATTVTLTWEAVEGATSYNVYQGEATEAIASVTETTYIVEGLTAETEYTFAVEAVNEAGATKSEIVSVTTLAEEPITPPTDVEIGYFPTTFYYDFEDGKMDGWKTIDADGNGTNWALAHGSYGGGVGDSYGLYSEITSNIPDNYVVTTSKYSLTESSELSFSHVQLDPFFCMEHIGVVISEDGEEFETIWEYDYNDLLLQWKEEVIDLSAYAGKDLYLGFRHFDCNINEASGIRIDNIRLYSEEPAVPANLKAEATETTVTLTWDKVDNANSYKIYSYTVEVVDTVDFTYYTLVKAGLKVTTFEITGLNPNTEYNYAVTSVNEFKESRWSTVTVKTLKKEIEPGEGEEILLYEDFEDYAAGDKIAEKGAEYWSTWSDKPGTAEDGVVAELDGNKCGYLTNGVDQILKLGGYQLGEFDLEYDVYIPNGNGAYYNILHEYTGNPNTSTWALQAYLQMTDDGNGDTKIADGHGAIHAAGDNAADIPCVWDGWMHFRIHINANVDKAEYYYTLPGGEEQFAFDWKWSKDTFDEAAGGRKLDAMNFYVWDDSRTYYIDNLLLKRIGGESAAAVAFDKEEVHAEMSADGDMTTVEFKIENIGTSIVDYVAWVDYGKGELSNKQNVVTYATEEMANSTSIGWEVNEPLTFEIAAFYPSSTYASSVMGTYITDAAYYLGKFLDENNQDVPMLEAGSDLVFRVYGQGIDGAPGEILAEKTVPADEIVFDWNVVTFDEPVALTGFDFYIAVEMTQCVNGAPMVFDGDKESDWVGYSDLVRQANGAFETVTKYLSGDAKYGNWQIMVNCLGNGVAGGWAELAKKDGQLEIGASETIDVNFTSLGLKDGEEYEATIVFKTTNDDMFELPVSLYVWGENVEEILSNTYNIYPNPTAAQVVVEGDNINYIAVYNSVGQLVKVVKTQDNVVDMSADENGVYFFNIVDKAGNSSVQRVVVAK